jgi:broad specificity phosphatase PhoE
VFPSGDSYEPVTKCARCAASGNPRLHNIRNIFFYGRHREPKHTLSVHEAMTTLYFVRHGDTGVRNRISGRSLGIHLSELGREQARRAAQQFTGIPISGLFSSPLERARETAEAIGNEAKISVQVIPELSEVQYGDWTGKSFDELANDVQWQGFNTLRSATQIPGGEHLLEVQSRVVLWAEKIRREHPQEHIVAVSHQDPIKAALMYYLGLHADMYARFQIDLASISALRVGSEHTYLLTLNHIGGLRTE